MDDLIVDVFNDAIDHQIGWGNISKAYDYAELYKDKFGSHGKLRLTTNFEKYELHDKVVTTQPLILGNGNGMVDKGHEFTIVDDLGEKVQVHHTNPDPLIPEKPIFISKSKIERVQ